MAHSLLGHDEAGGLTKEPKVPACAARLSCLWHEGRLMQDRYWQECYLPGAGSNLKCLGKESACDDKVDEMASSGNISKNSRKLTNTFIILLFIHPL